MLFDNIWETHKNYLHSFIKTKVNDESIVDDILQEVSIKLLANINRKTDIKNYKNWLFQVARNTIADHYRKNKKHNNLTTENTEIISESTAPCVCDLSGFVIQNYLLEKYSKPLYLSDVEKITQQEIANKLNLSLSATKSRIQRGREKLKELVTQCVKITYNEKRQISDFQLKNNCELPQELKEEMERINLIL